MLSLLFVVVVLETMLSCAVTKRSSSISSNRTSCMVVPMSSRIAMHAPKVVCSARLRGGLDDVQVPHNIVALLCRSGDEVSSLHILRSIFGLSPSLHRVANLLLCCTHGADLEAQAAMHVFLDFGCQGSCVMAGVDSGGIQGPSSEFVPALLVVREVWWSRREWC